MIIYKLELIEGDVIYYKNPFNANLAIADSLEGVKDDKVEDNEMILKREESITLQAKFIYIRVLGD